MNLKKIPEIVKKNIEIANRYVELYPQLKRYREVSELINTKYKTKKTPEDLWEESQALWDNLIKLRIHIVSNFLHRLEGKDAKAYLLNEKKVNVKSLLDSINKEIEKELNCETLDPLYECYDYENHKELLKLEKLWAEVKTEEDLCKVIQNPHDYSGWEYSPFWSRRPQLINIAINNDLKIEDDYALDLDENMIELLEEPNADEAKASIKQFESDQAVIQKIIEELIPICERAKAIDDCWENNFFNNKILHAVKRRMKE